MFGSTAGRITGRARVDGRRAKKGARTALGRIALALGVALTTPLATTFQPDSAGAATTTVLHVAGVQTRPCPLTSGIVYQHDPEGDGFEIELWLKPWQGAAVKLEAAEGRSFVSPRGSGDSVAYLDRPDPDSGTGEQSGPWRVVLRDLSSGQRSVLSETDTPKDSPDVEGDLAVWSERYGSQSDVILYDLARDSDSDGTPNHREVPRPEPDDALSTLAGGTDDQRQPSIGPAGVVWAKGASDKAVLFRADPRSSGSVTLDPSTGSIAPAPETGGDLVVWTDVVAGTSGIAVAPASGGDAEWLNAPGLDGEAVTDGEWVAWVSRSNETAQVLLSGAGEAGVRIHPTASAQTAPRLGAGVLAWVDGADGGDIAFLPLDGPSLPRTLSRLAGSDRYATAVAVSKDTYAAGSREAVVLATGEDYPDALSASALAGALEAPLLLTRRASLPSAVRAEIARLGASEVYVVGGEAAVSAEVRRTIRDGMKLALVEVQGRDRYETSARVATHVRGLMGDGFSGWAFVARGDGFADALAAAPFAAREGFPVLLTATDRLPAATESALKSLGVRHAMVVGGTPAVSSAVEGKIRSVVGAVTRKAGADRYATARALASYAVDQGWGDGSYVGVASGLTFPDALAGGVACGANTGVLLLTAPKSLSSAVRGMVVAECGDGSRVVVFGAASAVSATVHSQLRDALDAAP